MTLTIILIIYAIAITILLAYAVEKLGYWKQRALAVPRLRRRLKLYKKWVARLERDVDSRQQAINEWRMVANVLRDEAREQAQEAAYWRARKRLIYMALWEKRRKRMGRVTLARMAAL